MAGLFLNVDSVTRSLWWLKSPKNKLVHGRPTATFLTCSNLEVKFHINLMHEIWPGFQNKNTITDHAQQQSTAESIDGQNQVVEENTCIIRLAHSSLRKSSWFRDGCTDNCYINALHLRLWCSWSLQPRRNLVKPQWSNKIPEVVTCRLLHYGPTTDARECWLTIPIANQNAQDEFRIAHDGQTTSMRI